MSALQIIGGPQSNFVWVTRIVLAEKGIPYEMTAVMPHTPEVVAIHPVGKIPVMRHGSVALGESRAICRYIDGTFEGPSLMPADVAAAARVEQWVSIVMTHIDPVLMRRYAGAYFFPQTADRTPDRGIIEAALPEMERQFALLDSVLARHECLAGETFSLADAYLIPILFYMDQLPESGSILRNSVRVRAYYDRLLRRESIAATIPPPLAGLQSDDIRNTQRRAASA